MNFKGTIPFHKGGNKLYFFRNELLEWVMKGQEPTSSSGETIEERAMSIIASKKRKPASLINREQKEAEA